MPTLSHSRKETGDLTLRERWSDASRWWDVAACVMISAIIFYMQHRSGAYTATLALQADEPAHAVTSLMVRDYLAQHLGSNPMVFARDFYAHYPKVAFGHWPPLFYFLEALWMLVVGRSKVALLSFVGCCASALVCSMYLQVRRRCSIVAAVVSVLVLIHPQMFQEVLCMVFPDMLVALLVFWGAVYCAEYMRFEERRSAIVFVVLLMIGLLVHGRAAVLLLLPFWLVPVRPGASKLKWGIAAVVMLLVMQMPHFMGQAAPFTWSSFYPTASKYIVRQRFILGWISSGLMLYGSARAFVKGPQRQFWAAMAGLVVCGFVFFLLLPIKWDDRYLLAGLPGVAALAGGCVQLGLDKIPAGFRQTRNVMRFGAVTAAIFLILFTARHAFVKPDPGYAKLVADCLLCGHDVALIDGDGFQEGGLIVEASLSDPQRSHTVLRGSQKIAYSRWLLVDFRLLYASPDEVLRYLDRANVSLVLVQTKKPRPDTLQLQAAMQQEPQRWIPASAPSLKGVEIYTRVHTAPAARDVR